MSDEKPCVKCGSTDRLPPAKDGRKTGRCRPCHTKELRAARKKPSNSDGPHECILEGCTRRARSVKKPSPCNTCYTRLQRGTSPKFPVDPLLDYIESHGGNKANRNLPKRGSRISLESMDAFCIDVLKVHPWVVYGRLYFQECVS